MRLLTIVFCLICFVGLGQKDTANIDSLSIDSKYLDYLADSYWNNITDSTMYIMRVEPGLKLGKHECKIISLFSIHAGHGMKITEFIISSDSGSIKLYLQHNFRVGNKRKPKYKYAIELYATLKFSEFPFIKFRNMEDKEFRHISLDDYKKGNYLVKKYKSDKDTPSGRDY